jgi:hypothetical protein
MSELPGDPDDAEELIVGQYSDRPQLRPVFEAVLAAVTALGPVAVQPRKTLVSLSTPRRVFAVVQPTTRSRVDLGLGLEHECPGGRLLAARDLGAATVRIPLTRPGEVDAEVVGWLRHAYQENAAPPPPPRTDRNLFLAWGSVRDDGTLLLIRGSKLKLADVDPGLVEAALRPGHRLVARIQLTGAEAESALTWSAEPVAAECG